MPRVQVGVLGHREGEGMRQHTFCVWFRFADEDRESRHARLIDAPTSTEAMRWVRKLYSDVDRIFKVERIS